MGTPQWHEDGYPELREGRPWVMEEMIALEPAVAEKIVGQATIGRQIARVTKAVLAAREAGEPISVVGCGTSEHAARAIAVQLDDAFGHRGIRPVGRQALEATIDPLGGLTIAVSHDGGTRATLLAMEAAREAGGTVALITANPESAYRDAASMTVVTPQKDLSWCHTVAYISAMAVGAAVAAQVVGRPVDAAVLRRHLDECLGVREQGAEIAASFAGIEHLVVVGGGQDRITADELALKVEEGLHLPSSARDLETFGHGHLPACDARTGLVMIATEHRGRARRTDRGRLLLRAARRVGMPCAAIMVPAVESVWGRELTAAGRMLLPHASGLLPSTSALTASAIALQVLTLELVHARGTNPDLIRREEEPWREAAAIIEGDDAW